MPLWRFGADHTIHEGMATFIEWYEPLVLAS
jgi:hypothetical protein